MITDTGLGHVIDALERQSRQSRLFFDAMRLGVETRRVDGDPGMWARTTRVKVVPHPLFTYLTKAKPVWRYCWDTL